MTVSEILQKRYSCRGFKNDAVPMALLQQVFSDAQLSASNCNVQPWQVIVVSGDKKDQLKNSLIQTVMQQQKPSPDFDWKVAYQGSHRERQFGSANVLYNAMDIPREDKTKRQMAMLRNWSFFDAPHVAIFTMEKYLGIMGAVDMGIYTQTLSLLLEEQGIASCMQGAIGQFPEPIRKMFNVPEHLGILFGMSLGYVDDNIAANKARTDRVALEDSVTFYS